MSGVHAFYKTVHFSNLYQLSGLEDHECSYTRNGQHGTNLGAPARLGSSVGRLSLSRM